MKRIMAALAALSILSALSGCGKHTITPHTPTDEPVGSVVAQTVGESAATQAETTTQDATTATTAVPSTTAAQTTDSAGYVRPTEAVTYSAAGIPIANAFFSLMLPAEWDGHYYCETNYEGDVMTLTFREKSGAQAGAGGVLFTLALVPEGTDYDAAGARQLKQLTGDDDAYRLLLIYPASAQYNDQTLQQYDAMRSQIDRVLETLQPGGGFRF